jgi:hypothetical protein
MITSYSIKEYSNIHFTKGNQSIKMYGKVLKL